jgi:hypothetical protein
MNTWVIEKNEKTSTDALCNINNSYIVDKSDGMQVFTF